MKRAVHALEVLRIYFNEQHKTVGWGVAPLSTDVTFKLKEKTVRVEFLTGKTLTESPAKVKTLSASEQFENCQ
jgi:hypothetical protein